MNKTSAVTVIVVLVVLFGGFFITKGVDTTPVTYTGCVVTDTNTQFRTAKQGGNKHVIETENCGKLVAKKKIMDSVEKGSTYDFTANGVFKWGKTVTEAR